MDCEKFESAMMDELYGELDELTSAAAKRHIASCARCAALVGGLRATRRVASLPIVAPPAELEERILTAARDTQKVVPFRKRVANVVSVAGRWAMQPQAAVAVVFFVMLGGSVLLLRPASAPKSSAALSPPVTVTEQGAPAPEVSAMPTAIAAAPAASATSGADHDFIEDRRARTKSEAYASNEKAMAPPPVADQGPMMMKGAAGAVAGGRGGGLGDLQPQGVLPEDDLAAARVAKATKGCSAALAAFDRAIDRGNGTPVGWDALLEGALCRRNVGDLAKARFYLSRLLNVDSHKARARDELDGLDRQIAQAGNIGPGAAGHAAERAAPKAAAPAAASPPATRPAATAIDSNSF
jgi:hypothetical protein